MLHGVYWQHVYFSEWLEYGGRQQYATATSLTYPPHFKKLSAAEYTSPQANLAKPTEACSATVARHACVA